MDAWIPMRVDLLTDPKVVRMSRACHVTPCDIIGRLLCIWGAVRARGVRIERDAVLEGFDNSLLNDLAGLEGFCEALVDVDWCREDDAGLLFPGFFDGLNVDPLEKRRQDARNRKREQRARSRKMSRACHADVTQNVTRMSRDVTQKSASKEKESTIQAPHASACPPGGANGTAEDFKPTRAEAIAYGATLGLTEESVGEWYDDHEAGGWRVRSRPMKSWRASLRNFARRTKRQAGDNGFEGAAEAWSSITAAVKAYSVQHQPEAVREAIGPELCEFVKASGWTLRKFADGVVGERDFRFRFRDWKAAQ